MAVSYEINYKDILRDVYDSEELKIDSQRSKSIAKVIDQLCVSENTAFSDLFSLVSKEVEQKRKEPAAIRNSFQACYMYQAERLPVVLQQLGKEQQGSMNDSLLWQVNALSIACSIIAFTASFYSHVIYNLLVESISLTQLDNKWQSDCLLSLL